MSSATHHVKPSRSPRSPAIGTRRALRSQRGNALMISMIVLTGLAALGNLTVVTVQGGSTAAAADRFHTIAMYAAESGGAATMEFLRTNVSSGTR